MKSFLLTLLFLCGLCFCSYSKSRLGEYYFGFGVMRANGGNGIDVEGDAIALSVNTLASDSADFIFSFDYGKLETNASKDTAWSINADYVMQFGDADATHSLFRPYAGLGIGYLRDPSDLKLGDDGLTWRLLAGSEVLITENWHLGLNARYFGLLNDLSEADLTLGFSVGWWIDDVHGIALEYDHSLDSELEFISLKYLYSWR